MSDDSDIDSEQGNAGERRHAGEQRDVDEEGPAGKEKGPGFPEEPATLRARLGAFWSRHRTLFWTLHSGWALATGVAVVYFARERYGFVPWVVLFLVLTWASTLFFSRRVGDSQGDIKRPGLVEETTSYLTRTMYQETLFFLLPFYAYSTVLGSPNVVFTGFLVLLGVTSCFDLLFDRWLRSSPTASLVFFAVVAFAAINLLLPILLPLDPTVALRWSAGIAVASAVPLALHGAGPTRRGALWLAVASAGFLGAILGAPQLVPPVPLRVESAVFSSGFDVEKLTVADTLGAEARAGRVVDGLFVLVEVFSPSVTPTEVTMEWKRDGEVLRTSGPVPITAHEWGFRLWEALRPATVPLDPGRYSVVLRTTGNRVFGEASIRLVR